MSLNPYQSPAAVDDAIDASLAATDEELQATSRVRWAVLLMAAGAFANLACTLTSLRGTLWVLSSIVLGWNLFWLGVFCCLAWRFGPNLLEWLAQQFHGLFGGATVLDAWLTSYRQSLWPLPIAAALGLPLWLLWLLCYFGGGMRIGSPLNTFFLIAGNALGAWVYLTVIAGWVRLRMSDPHSGGSLPPATGPASAAGPE